jgi:hypothetical protein
VCAVLCALLHILATYSLTALKPHIICLPLFLLSPTHQTHHQPITHHSLWALGNLAGDGPEFRSILHANGALTPTAQVYASTTTTETATTAAWALSNLAKGSNTPATPFLQSGVLPPILSSLVSSSSNGQQQQQQQQQQQRLLLIESCWLLAHLTAKENEAVHHMLASTTTTTTTSPTTTAANNDMIRLLCSQLIPNDEELARPVLRCLANMFSASGIPPQHLDQALGSPTFVPAILYFVQGGSPTSGNTELFLDAPVFV